MKSDEIKLEVFEPSTNRGPLFYNDYVTNLNTELEQQFQKMMKTHNFELGNEFECAICRILRKTLPDKYGVCRGFVVDQAGNKAGNDIIIYDQHRFPTLRIKDEGESYATADYIPIEAVYAYIEAKHTIELEGDGPSSLRHACQQVASVRKLCSEREVVTSGYLAPYIDVTNSRLQLGFPKGFPQYRNPLFSMIFARQVREKPRADLILESSIIQGLTGGTTFPEHSADYIILGCNNALLPVTAAEGTIRELDSPFFVPGSSHMVSMMTNELAFGIGFCALFFALDWIQLGTMIWGDVLGNALGTRMIEPDQDSVNQAIA